MIGHTYIYRYLHNREPDVVWQTRRDLPTCLHNREPDEKRPANVFANKIYSFIDMMYSIHQ